MSTSSTSRACTPGCARRHAKSDVSADAVVSAPATTARTPSSTRCEIGGGGMDGVSSWFYVNGDTVKISTSG